MNGPLGNLAENESRDCQGAGCVGLKFPEKKRLLDKTRESEMRLVAQRRHAGSEEFVAVAAASTFTVSHFERNGVWKLVQEAVLFHPLSSRRDN